MSDCNKANNRSLKVRQLQRTLYLKSKQSKEVRFYSLYDKIYREDILWEAWRQVKVNKGSPVSPLYSNIYLNVIDQVWHARGYPEKLSATLHRYCDDVILVC